MTKKVYSYVAEDGTVFWSFTKLSQTVSPTKKLTIQSRAGTPLVPFLIFLRDLATESAEDEVESSGS